MFGPQTALTLAQQAMEVTLMVSAPLLLAALATGLLVSILQAATQINEMTLSFIPKLVAMFALLVCNLALGILTRAAPQLNLLSVGFPVTLLTGLWWLAHGMPWTVQAMQSTLEQWPAFLPMR